MTAFVLVSGGYTGGWIWREMAALLRERGHTALPVTLTGMGDRRHLAGPDTDLETHIEDIVQVLDHEDVREGVLVGHCYGLLPLLGAADRRPDRAAALVYLDTGLPGDGDAGVDVMPDPAVRDRLLRRAAEVGGGRFLPPPPLDDEELWGSLTGVSPADRERLARLAAPQPLATLTRPLRLTGAAAELPGTGVFCTANGASIAAVEALVATGDPRFAVLTEPRVGFFDLDTGHYPMLSRPGELTEVLLRAAAGEGRRLG
ncbi:MULTISPECIES: alpha/beta fold hydrolase [unclassified Streptomyces]|uniref:alpha/beta fold hydrolase n=1 Tax=unclassified Streptomyces TaxID=2593676 RepID=UPI0003799B0F|nr:MULTISPECIES: alpha/beta fold hydrolase [unclassified Streptomyces]MYT33959.1 alpha/beta fold hydrolase [Streptomyces sp. SID8354]